MVLALFTIKIQLHRGYILRACELSIDGRARGTRALL
jgi:hypothetical protein